MGKETERSCDSLERVEKGARPPRPGDHFRARDSAETSSRVNEIAPRDSPPSLGISQRPRPRVFIPLIARGMAEKREKRWISLGQRRDSLHTCV